MLACMHACSFAVGRREGAELWVNSEQQRGCCLWTERTRLSFTSHQEQDDHDDEALVAWDSCSETFKAVLALLKVAEPNPASTAALVRFLTSTISRCRATFIPKPTLSGIMRTALDPCAVHLHMRGAPHQNSGGVDVLAGQIAVF